MRKLPRPGCEGRLETTPSSDRGRARAFDQIPPFSLCAAGPIAVQARSLSQSRRLGLGLEHMMWSNNFPHRGSDAGSAETSPSARSPLPSRAANNMAASESVSGRDDTPTATQHAVGCCRAHAAVPDRGGGSTAEAAHRQVPCPPGLRSGLCIVHTIQYKTIQYDTLYVHETR